jgi:hypothetical protein
VYFWYQSGWIQLAAGVPALALLAASKRKFASSNLGGSHFLPSSVV